MAPQRSRETLWHDCLGTFPSCLDVPGIRPRALRETHADRRGLSRKGSFVAQRKIAQQSIGNFDDVEQDVHDRYRFRNETEEDETIPAAPDAIMDEDHLFVHALVDLLLDVEVVKPIQSGKTRATE